MFTKMPHKNAFIGNLFSSWYCHPMCWQDGLHTHCGETPLDGPWGQSMSVTEHSHGQEGAAMQTDPVLWP